jgi:hypothetical protein
MKRSRCVVAVSQHPERADVLDTLLVNGGEYDRIFVESVAGGYSRIKALKPDLIVFMGLDDDAQCELLTRLTLDDETSGIPVDTWGTRYWPSDFEDMLPDVRWDESCHITAVRVN